MKRTPLIGRWGEDIAARYLEQQGYRILARNLRARHGEIDIIACRADLLVFVEVKASQSLRFPSPEYAVTPRKRAHLLQVAEQYLQQHPEFHTWQLDVIAIEQQDGLPAITHLENVFSG